MNTYVMLTGGEVVKHDGCRPSVQDDNELWVVGDDDDIVATYTPDTYVRVQGMNT